MAKKKAGKRGGGLRPRRLRVRPPDPPVARGRIGYRNRVNNQNSKFMEDQLNTFRVYGDSIGTANPNKDVTLTATHHLWTVLGQVRNIDPNTIEIDAQPHRKQKKSRSRGTDDDLTVTITFDPGTANEECVECAFEDVEYS